MQTKPFIRSGIFAAVIAVVQTLHAGTDEAFVAQFKPVPAPPAPRLMLRTGDRLAICGDSITQQKQYSRLMEDYLTMCVPELRVTVRQYGWGGEWAREFLARMTNDCLRFHPTIATTCYGMNDHGYRPYTDEIGQGYRSNSAAVIEAFKAAGARVVMGSPGCIGKAPPWTWATNGTMNDMDLNLCQLRNIGVGLAREEHVGFADVFWPMMTAWAAARAEYGTNYALCGGDGVHPRWAGHLIMGYAFLKALGLQGDIGTFTVNLKRGTMKVSAGHEVLSAGPAGFVIRSSRYPFCPLEPAAVAATNYPVCGKDAVSSDRSICSGMTLVPFNQELNRLLLVAKGGSAASYRVTWGEGSKVFSAGQLAHGINLAAEFPCNPFAAAFARVDVAVAAKQGYETFQIQQELHGKEAETDMEGVVARTEQEHARLAAAVQAAFVPVEHTVKIEPAGAN